MAQLIIMDHGGGVEKTESMSDTSVGTNSEPATKNGSKSISLDDRIAIVQQALYDLRSAGIDVQRTNIKPGSMAAVILPGLVWDDAGNLAKLS
jgi:hypothetical protein